jgi:transcriptional regulator with XRE-family HTH domain
MSLGERIKQLRKKAGLSQGDIGKIVGVPYQSIQNVELGRVKRPRFIIQLAEALNTSIDYLITGSENDGAKSVLKDINIIGVDKHVEQNLERDFYVVSIDRGKKLFLADGATEVAKVVKLFSWDMT